MGVIKIRGLEISAKHGVRDSEKVNPQPFIFDADMTFDFFDAAQKDDLALTVNYSKACDIIAEITRINSFDLIETLAYSCANRLMDEFPLQKISLTVYKPQAPVKHVFGAVGVSVELTRERAYLSLGSSQGDRVGYLDRALEMLAKTQGITLLGVSRYIETAPVGGVAQNAFLNCAAEILTYLAPEKLLENIHRIEAACGRVRKERWGDRTLDIDIIFYGSQIIESPVLQVPHPEYHRRDFVLEPLAEIAPEFICPVFHKKIKNMLKSDN